MVHIRHTAAFSFFVDGIACGTLGADKQHRPAIGSNPADRIDRVVVERQGLFKVNDMDLVAGTENEFCHFRVPETGLVTKMHACLKHQAHRNARHGNIS